MDCMHQDPFCLPDEVSQTLLLCALRFDGYRWLEAQSEFSKEKVAEHLSDPIRTQVFYEDEAKNFAACFFLQRFLGKWGGETLPESDVHHTAYRLLFLHLYARPRSKAWVKIDFERRWQGLEHKTLEEHAAVVRRMLLRPTLLGADEK